jgi:small subunit ribosomal protein S3Ae
MREIMVNQATSCDLKELVRKFIPEMIGKEIEKATSSIYPLQNVFIRKVKILKAPKFDLGKLMEVCHFCSIVDFKLLPCSHSEWNFN